jgi:TATA-binding protein-associated factor Taf7
MAGSLGMLDSWNRILELIPPSRRSTAEQQQRLSSMQLSMIMGAAAMNQKNGQLQQRSTARQSAVAAAEEQAVGDEDNKEEEESMEDEEGDDEEVRAMKAEIRQLRAEKLSSAATAFADGVNAPASASDPALHELVQQLAKPASIDDPD